MNFEKTESSKNIDKLDKRKYEACDFVIANQAKQRINEMDFVDIFGAEDVKNDIKFAQQLEKKFKEDSDRFTDEELETIKERDIKSQALETMIVNQGDEFMWFGADAVVQRASEYDDLKNGVDAIVEFEKQTGNETKYHHIALAIDAVMASDFSVVDRKIKKNLWKIKEPEGGANVKYGITENGAKKGRIQIAIPVVIGLEGRRVDELVETTSQIIRLQAQKERSQSAQEVYNAKVIEFMSHPAQKVFLKQITLQLDMYQKTLKNIVGNRTREYSEKINELQDIFRQLEQEKKDIKIGDCTDDKVLEFIETIVQSPA